MCISNIYLIYPFLNYLFWIPVKIITIQIYFFCSSSSLKDEPKANPAVNSSPSSWGKTWITMTQQSSTALSMEKTNSSVWKISGRPGKHLKVKKKGAKSPEILSQECQILWISGALGRVCSSQEECAAFPPLSQALCSSSSLFEVWIPRISSGLGLPNCKCCTWAWPPKCQLSFCSSAPEMCVK